MTYESLNQTVKDYSIVMGLLVLYLLYAVHSNSQSIKQLHGESFTNPYASRLPTVVDSGLTTNQVLEWGNQINGESCPTLSQADAYLDTAAGKYYGNTDNDTFMSGYEPPVFWPIGNVQKQRDTRIIRHNNNNNSQVNYSNNAPNNTGFQYISSNVPYNRLNSNGQPVLNSNGNPLTDSQTMYTRCAPGETAVDNVCVASTESMSNGSWQANSGRRELFNPEDLVYGDGNM